MLQLLGIDRGRRRRSSSDHRHDPLFDLGYEQKRNVHTLPSWWSFAILAGVLLLAALSRHQLNRLPRALTANDEAHHRQQTGAEHSGSFIAERAHVDLRIMDGFGPRPTGTPANEHLAVDFLKRELAHIQASAHPAQSVYADVQRVSGAYWAAFRPHGMTNVYRDVQNVVAKLRGQRERAGHGQNETLMLNCHFDSVAGSPGASDDAASCCVMLEILRVLSRRPTVLRHSVLMLFNGAEETPLQASHGFITQHEWASGVRAFLNLESVGSNGKEILFQSGPEHAWLIDMYKEVVPHPNAQVAAEEIFQSGLVPSDTDFRIFRDYGHVPGMDFAHVMNGYRYHTRYDSVEYISPAVLQRTGDNVLALVQRIADSELLDHVNAHTTGRSVYFDVLGLCMIVYAEGFGVLLTAVVSLAVLGVSFALLGRATRATHLPALRRECAAGAAVSALAWLAAWLACVAVAGAQDWTGHALAWYRHPVLAAVLYCAPATMAMCAVHRLFGGSHVGPLSAGLRAQARLAGVNVLWALAGTMCAVYGVRSAYVFVVPMVVSLLTNVAVGLLGAANSNRRWLYVHLAGQALFVLWATHFYHLLTAIFIPIAGRSGGQHNPELSLAHICCLLTAYTSAQLMPLVPLLRRLRGFLIALAALFLVTRFGCLPLTQYGFPYRGGATGVDNPTPQRHMITHAVRTVYDANGAAKYSDAGFYFRDLDRNAHKTLESLIAPDVLQPQELNALCQSRPFCGLPFHSSRQLHTSGFWLPGPAPILREEAHLVNLTRTRLSANDHLLRFTLTGQVLLSLQLQLHAGVRLIGWSLMPEVPPPNVYQQREAYFAMMTHGLNDAPRPVSLMFRTQAETPEESTPSLVDVSLVTVHWEYHREHTAAFAAMLAKLPDWTFTVPSVASVQSWTF